MKKLFISFGVAVLLFFGVSMVYAYSRSPNLTHYELSDHLQFDISAEDMANLAGSGCNYWSIYFNNLTPKTPFTWGVFGGDHGGIGLDASDIKNEIGGTVNKVVLYSIADTDTRAPCAGVSPAGPPYEFTLETGNPLFTIGDTPFPTPTPTPTPTPSPSNTPTGTNVVVQPSNETVITFTEVISSGETTVASGSSGSTPPSGFKLGNPPIYYSISTTALFTPPVTVCITYDDTQFVNEANLKLTHFEGGVWVNSTTSLDTINNIICGQVSSFSEFTLVENITVSHIYSKVESFQLDSGIEQGLLAKLDAAIKLGDKENAKNVLGSFINLVNAQEGKKISIQQTESLIADTTALIDSL